MGVRPEDDPNPKPDDWVSPVLDFYPENFEIDLNGNAPAQAWRGVALLPFIDEKRLFDAVATIDQNELTEEERLRNLFGRDLIVFGPANPNYMTVYNDYKNGLTVELDPKKSQIWGSIGPLDEVSEYKIAGTPKKYGRVIMSVFTCAPVPSGYTYPPKLLPNVVLPDKVLNEESLFQNMFSRRTEAEREGGYHRGQNHAALRMINHSLNNSLTQKDRRHSMGNSNTGNDRGQGSNGAQNNNNNTYSYRGPSQNAVKQANSFLSDYSQFGNITGPYDHYMAPPPPAVYDPNLNYTHMQAYVNANNPYNNNNNNNIPPSYDAYNNPYNPYNNNVGMYSNTPPPVNNYNNNPPFQFGGNSNSYNSNANNVPNMNLPYTPYTPPAFTAPHQHSQPHNNNNNRNNHHNNNNSRNNDNHHNNTGYDNRRGSGSRGGGRGGYRK
eukprot:TRINITY_DN2458_c0_g3_i2.p1 TRINITY_DN2458_c0_g3~~TRINITY_DN2458_c0_g3_i2.p1  ORF type:complete len:437 (+),score=106.43 TRINITY_DN2458_c0_g3_i2:267-1577(+)